MPSRPAGNYAWSSGMQGSRISKRQRRDMCIGKSKQHWRTLLLRKGTEPATL